MVLALIPFEMLGMTLKARLNLHRGQLVQQ